MATKKTRLRNYLMENGAAETLIAENGFNKTVTLDLVCPIKLNEMLGKTKPSKAITELESQWYPHFADAESQPPLYGKSEPGSDTAWEETIQ